MSDQKLIEQVAAGDTDAIRRLYERFGRPVFSVGYRALGERSLAEDVVQLTFLKVWQSAHRFDPSRDVAPWLYTIARRTAIDVYRREARHFEAPPELEPELAALPKTFEDLWEIWEVRHALDVLPDHEKVVIEALHYRGWTMQETADRLEMPLGTVKSRAHRAHSRLAAALGHLKEVSA